MKWRKSSIKALKNFLILIFTVTVFSLSLVSLNGTESADYVQNHVIYTQYKSADLLPRFLRRNVVKDDIAELELDYEAESFMPWKQVSKEN